MTSLIEKIKSPHHLRQQLGTAFFLALSVLAPPGPLSAAERAWVFPLGLFLFLLGFLGRVWASGFLVKNDRLTTAGPYGRVRNPIYVANLLLGAGLILQSGLYWTFAILGLLYGICYRPGMRVEEENLRRRFGPAFDAYAAAVPLILPKSQTAQGYGGGQYSWRAYFDNREQFVSVGLLAAFGFLLCRRWMSG